MPATEHDTEQLLETANHLYWNSEETIDEIARALDISRNTLYSAVRPISAGVNCAHCGERMVFTNRSSRSSRTATCRACGTRSERVPAPAEEERASPPELPELDGDHSRGRRAGLSRWREELAAVSPERMAMVGGAAALGVVLGAAATRAVREMR